MLLRLTARAYRLAVTFTVTSYGLSSCKADFHVPMLIRKCRTSRCWERWTLSEILPPELIG